MKMYYDFSDYSEIIKYLIEQKSLVDNNKVTLAKLAESLNMSQSSLSQILSKKRSLSQEQACGIAVFFKLSDRQTEYLLFLVIYNSTEHFKIKEIYKRKLEEFRNYKNELDHMVSGDIDLTDQEKAIYYSSWLFSAVRNLVEVNGQQSIRDLSQRLSVADHFIEEVLQHLMKMNLIYFEDGHWKNISKTTYVAPESIFSSRHLLNWRQCASAKVTNRQHPDMFLTVLMSLSKKDWMELRKKLLDEVELIYKKIEKSPAEEVVCLNMDLFTI